MIVWNGSITRRDSRVISSNREHYAALDSNLPSTATIIALPALIKYEYKYSKTLYLAIALT